MGFLSRQSNSPLRKYLRFLFLTPLVIPPYMSSIAWIHLMGTNGVLSVIVMNIFRLDNPVFFGGPDVEQGMASTDSRTNFVYDGFHMWPYSRMV